ncbi:hypothetical protein EVA_10104, partial [gut metagenome]
KIAAVRTGSRQGMQDVPREPVLIKSARLLPKVFSRTDARKFVRK